MIRKARGRSGSVDYGNGTTGNSVMMSSGSGLDLRSLIGEQERSLEVKQTNFSKVEHQLQQLEVPEEYVGARCASALFVALIVFSLSLDADCAVTVLTGTATCSVAWRSSSTSLWGCIGCRAPLAVLTAT